MAPSDPRRRWRSAPYQQDTSTATLWALLLAISVPAVLVAVIFGWRPLDSASLEVFHQTLARITGRGVAAAPTPAGSGALPDGWFFTETVEQVNGTPARGYPVTDADGIPFWTAYQHYGGPPHLGYPLSGRFRAEGAVVQVFQRGVLRHDPTADRVVVGRLLDRLHAEGYDPALADQWGIPELELAAPGEPSSTLATERIDALLSDHPAFRAYLAAAPDPLALFGLPTSGVHDAGEFYTVRFQSGALQLWKVETPWAVAGAVTAVNVGEIAAALGVFSGEALRPTTLSETAR